MNLALAQVGYKSKQDFLLNCLLKACIDSYRRIEKTSLLEEKIRDQFIYDFLWKNPVTKDLIQKQLLTLNWERRSINPDKEMSRADISFSFLGLEFIIECKRLKFADSKYLNDGIKRFVDKKYAANDSHAGMIGFIIAGDIDNIVDNLKSKVALFYYSQGSEELLKKKCLSWKYSFQSAHNRNDDTTIYLYHLFFDFIPND